MDARKQSSLLFLILVLAFGLVCQSQAASYPAPIKYRQLMTKIVDETNLQGWPSGHETAGRYIEEIVASPDNNILAFTVIAGYDIYKEKRLFVLGNGGRTGRLHPLPDRGGGGLQQRLRLADEPQRQPYLFLREVWRGYLLFGTLVQLGGSSGLQGSGWRRWPLALHGTL